MRSAFLKKCYWALVVIIVISMFSPLCSAENQNKENEARLTYIINCSGNIDHGALSTTVKTKISGNSSVTSVKIKMELQKLSSGTYSTVETWEQTFSGNEGIMEESKVTNPFSTYRLKATFTAYSGSQSETKVVYAYES